MLVIEGNNELVDNGDLWGWLGGWGKEEEGGEGEEGDVVKKYSVNSHIFVTNNTDRDSTKKFYII